MFATFKKWKAKVENHIDWKIKCLMSNGGEEYNKLEFKTNFVYEGIGLMMTVPSKTKRKWCY